jgi:hypothetical protein|uniref:MARVEL domain-containing protein n=1 Tax=viral metagenome TaxID=1070528 RepID=A0A6C0AL48_9ZZZZ
MKLIRKFFIASIILSIGSIVGVSVWADSNDIFTLSDSYSFYWFVAITSLLFSLASYFTHTLKYIISYTRQSTKLSNLHMYAVSIFGSIYTIFWLGASASVASNLRYCLVIKNNYRYYNYNCNGQIISTVFGFLNFILWCILCYYSGSYWYYITYVKNDIELQSNQGTNVSPIPITEELPSIPIIEELPSIPPVFVTEELPPIPITEELPPIPITEELPSIPITEELPSIPITEELPSIPITESIPVIKELPLVPITESSLNQIMESFPIISEKE